MPKQAILEFTKYEKRLVNMLIKADINTTINKHSSRKKLKEEENKFLSQKDVNAC